MRKKFLAAFIVAAGVAFTGYNMMQAKNDKNTLSDLVLANVEALANRGEIPEVTITCGKTGGKCWESYGTCKIGWFHEFGDCRFTGSMNDSCNTPCD